MILPVNRTLLRFSFFYEYTDLEGEGEFIEDRFKALYGDHVKSHIYI